MNYSQMLSSTPEIHVYVCSELTSLINALAWFDLIHVKKPKTTYVENALLLCL